MYTFSTILEMYKSRPKNTEYEMYINILTRNVHMQFLRLKFTKTTFLEMYTKYVRVNFRKKCTFPKFSKFTTIMIHFKKFTKTTPILKCTSTFFLKFTNLHVEIYRLDTIP